jgi:polyhydroxyalkanoate synthesis regulator phasin
MNREDIKAVVKAEMGGVMAISPDLYGKWLDSLVERFGLTKDEAREIAKEALNELPPIDWD